MPIPSVTQKFMCTLFVFTMICGVWQYAAIENTFYFEDRENIVSEEICEYAVTQRIAEHKRLNYNTNTSGIEPLLPLLSLLLGFLLYAPVVRKIHLCRLQTAMRRPIVRAMIKTAIENQQHWIVEGAYIPFDWAKDFTPAEQRQIH